jgi:histidinol dehydrogenase
MKEIVLKKKLPILEFEESKMSSKNIATLKKFKSIVIESGDDGLKEISKILNEKVINKLKVTKPEFKSADKLLNDDLKNAILVASSNIRKYHEKQLDGLSIKNIETTKGVNLWSEFKPIDVIGLYIPGGTHLYLVLFSCKPYQLLLLAVKILLYALRLIKMEI